MEGRRSAQPKSDLAEASAGLCSEAEPGRAGRQWTKHGGQPQRREAERGEQQKSRSGPARRTAAAPDQNATMPDAKRRERTTARRSGALRAPGENLFELIQKRGTPFGHSAQAAIVPRSDSIPNCRSDDQEQVRSPHATVAQGAGPRPLAPGGPFGSPWRTGKARSPRTTWPRQAQPGAARQSLAVRDPTWRRMEASQRDARPKEASRKRADQGQTEERQPRRIRMPRCQT